MFHGFQQQLSRSIELEHMKRRQRAIVKHPFAMAALNQQQHTELRWLIMRLVKESETVIQARARIERDVKGFLKTGLAAEHHRVGLLLNEILREALNIDWASAAVRRKDGPLPPVAERLRFKSLDDGQADDLELSRKIADLNQVDDDFWRSFASLDRYALVRETLALLKRSGRALSIAELAAFLPPTNDLESLTVWLTMAREAGIVFREEAEAVEVVCSDGPRCDFRFRSWSSVPRRCLTSSGKSDDDGRHSTSSRGSVDGRLYATADQRRGARASQVRFVGVVE